MTEINYRSNGSTEKATKESEKEEKKGVNQQQSVNRKIVVAADIEKFRQIEHGSHPPFEKKKPSAIRRDGIERKQKGCKKKRKQRERHDRIK